MTEIEATNDQMDNQVDVDILRCLNLDTPQSFFLFAGAGSGKTRSLVTALDALRAKYGPRLRANGQRIRVITYTNAACDEIQSRLDFDSVVEVSTIHSFAWSLLEGFTRDIREWLRVNLADEIEEVRALELRGRTGTKASADRLSKISSKTRRLENLNAVRKFNYSPTGTNKGRDSLSHAEVIKISSDFLKTKANMQHILVGAFPFLLVDESQDTNKHLVDALFAVQAAHRMNFALGLLGDMMQRVYSDGKEGLGKNLPQDWAKPTKKLNHRCPKRVVRLINQIRRDIDGQEQIASTKAIEGHVRLFIIPSDTADQPANERAVASAMAVLTGDPKWNNPRECKHLILEHRMAASRMGFSEFFVPLHDIDDFKTGVLDGSLPATRFLTKEVLPLVRAHQRGDNFAVARIMRSLCPILSAENLRAADDASKLMKKAGDAVESLMELWANENDPALIDVLQNIYASGLMVVPDSLRPNITRGRDLPEDARPRPEHEDDEDFEANMQTDRSLAIDNFLAAPFSQVEPYHDYISGNAPFDTHQGVKGREFPRVMVIMDDATARGFMFSYEKLFGAKATGDSSTEGTRRLFYVTCSRAEKSLALVAYSAQPHLVKAHVIREGWFEEGEVQIGV
jgi:DNA helicase II / ATP-dependent DNA helicase PcrA